jgi:hypothetical protein
MLHQRKGILPVRKSNIILPCLLGLALLGLSNAEPTPGYNTEIPAKIMTPDTVETRLGTLKFFDGLPHEETVKTVYDHLDFIRGVETFLNGIPATSIEGLRLGMLDMGAKECHQVLMFQELLDSDPLFLTGNTDTVYALSLLNLKEDGPTVVEIPKGCGPGTVNDAFFRFVTDMGGPGPDRGEGGKYLILPPGYDGEVPEGYFVSKSTSYVNWLILRGFLVDGKPDYSVNMFKTGLNVYPLSAAQKPPKMEFINGSRKSFNTIHANNYEFFEELHTVIEREPVDLLEPQLRGLFASVGIQKGKPFQPDARMKEILTDAVAVGNATARALVFDTRDRSAYFYPNSFWKMAFVGGDYRWLIADGEGGRNLDARTMFFYQATVNTPAMALKMVGKGSQYALATQDNDGNYLDGNKNYTLLVPAKVPAKDFWSVVVYDPQTRSELQTSQPLPSRNNKRDKLQMNQDGSCTLYFGPKAPTGKENNWVQTVPGKGWFACFRLYGPLEPWFDKTWQLNDFELVK